MALKIEERIGRREERVITGGESKGDEIWRKE